MSHAPDSKDPRGRYAGFETLPIRVIVRVGGTRCTLGRLGSLEKGDVIPLECDVTEPFELEADGILLGKVKPVAGDSTVAAKLVEVAGGDDAARR